MVEVGASVTVQEEDDAPETYLLVGAKEADPRNGRISNESPIGSALMGRRVGDVVKCQNPRRRAELKLLRSNRTLLSSFEHLLKQQNGLCRRVCKTIALLSRMIMGDAVL